MAGADPILASVLQRRVQAISREMATVLMRSSRSPIFNEIGDLVTVIFDRGGRTLAQTEYASIIANGAQPPLQRIIEYFGDDLHDGDVILHNDVYSGGNQNADVGVFLPIFHEGELVAWSASKGHVADIGGMTAGGYDPRAREVWQEAFRIPPLKIHDRGELRRDVWDLVRANIRFEIVAEDIKAMIGACTIGKRRLVDVLERYGVERFDAHMDYVIDASERQVRAELRRWPDGTYHGESWMVSDGLDPTKRYRIAVAVTIAGSEITFDFSETDDQAPGFTNMPAASAIGAIRIAFLMLLAAGGLTTPTNHGLFAPVHTVFRKGSLLDPHFPASTIFGNQMCDEVLEAIMRALADVLPDRVTAGWNQYLCTALSAIDPRTNEPSVSLTIFQRGGPGAMRGADGYDALGFTGTPGSMRSPDMEMFELSTPHLDALLRVPARLGRPRRVARRLRHPLELDVLRRGRDGDDDRRRRRGRGRRPGRGPVRRRARRAQRAAPALPGRQHARLGLQGDHRAHPAGDRVRGGQRRRRRVRRRPPARPRARARRGARRPALARGRAARLRRRARPPTGARSTRTRRPACGVRA